MTEKEKLKKIFSTNLKRYMKLRGKSRNDICDDLGFNYFTVSDWVNGKKYPRMDKIETLAKYFGVLISDLIEEKTEKHHEMKKNNDILSDIIVRMRTDSDFLSVVETLNNLDSEKLSSVRAMLVAFMK